jgi:hypothetical protein
MKRQIFSIKEFSCITFALNKQSEAVNKVTVFSSLNFINSPILFIIYYGIFLIYYSVNNGVDKYLSPVSGNRTTIVLPSFSGRFAICVAAHVAAPEDMMTSPQS